MRVTSIILMAIGFFSLVGAILSHSQREKVDPAGLGLATVMGITGVVLFVRDRKNSAKRKRAEFLVLQMLRDEGTIDAFRCAQVLGLDVGDMKRLILDLQREGVVPYDARIV